MLKDKIAKLTMVAHNTLINTAVVDSLSRNMGDMCIFFKEGPPTASDDYNQGYREGNFWVNMERWEIYRCYRSNELGTKWSYNAINVQNPPYDPEKSYKLGDYVSYGHLSFKAEANNPPGMHPGKGRWSMRMVNNYLSGSIRNKSSAMRMAMSMLCEPCGSRWSPRDIMDELHHTQNRVTKHVKTLIDINKRMRLLELCGVAKSHSNGTWSLNDNFINYIGGFPVHAITDVHVSWSLHKANTKNVAELVYDKEVVSQRSVLFEDIMRHLQVA